MEWYWILLIVAGGLILIYTIFCIVIAKGVLKSATTPRAFTLPEARSYQTEHENQDFSEYDGVWRKENFSVQGVHGKIVGEIIFANSAANRNKVVVICHGHTWNRINSVKYAQIFYKSGYNVVIYDHAYFGESEGKFTTLGYYERRDLDSVLNMVRDKFGSDAFVGLHGESMGAVTVLSELGLRTDLDFVVADCPFSDTVKYYRQLCIKATHFPGFPIVDFANAMSKHKFGYNFKAVSPIKDVKNSDVPVCFIHGKIDTFIRPSHSEKMYAVCKNPLSELHLIEGAGHARSHQKNNVLYTQIVSEFVRKIEKSQNIQIHEGEQE